MSARREFLLSAAGATVLLTVGGCAAFGGDDNAPQSATAITKIFGDGMRFVPWPSNTAAKYRRPRWIKRNTALQDEQLSGFMSPKAPMARLPSMGILWCWRSIPTTMALCSP